MDNNLIMNQHQKLNDAERIREFQRKLYLKAKQEKEFKFYALYDKVTSSRFLHESYRRVKKNGGSSGVDNVSFKQIEEQGLDEYLKNIHEELKNFTYKPSAVKRVYIPKANGKQRPLGIPTIKDRIVQMSCKMVIEPIFEADFKNCSYGFRPKRSASMAIEAIRKHIKEGKIEILDADLTAYFDTIPHNKLMILVEQRISDRHILKLIRMWLKAPISENNRISGGKKNKYGTPQGGVISPLLANIYLHLLDTIVNKPGRIFEKCGISMVRYADDFVLMGEKITKDCIKELQHILKRMELQLNTEKSKLLNAVDTSFDFLGFTFRHDRDLYVIGKKYCNIIPSCKSMKKIKEKLGSCLKKHIHYPPELLIRDINAIERGWINYFSIKGISYPKVALKEIRFYLSQRLRRYFKRKSQRRCKLYNHGDFEWLVKQYGLIDPTKYKLV